jgi:hypothetical protein
MRRAGPLASLALLVVSGLVTLAAAELLLRWFYPQQLAVWHNTRDGMVIHPPGGQVHLAKFGQTVRFNSFGMRDREHALEKAEGTFRVLVFGDSFIEALQVGLEESFSPQLEERLKACSAGRVEVLSAAVSGWGTDEQLAYLARYGWRFRPDLILVAVTIHNDVADNLEELFHELRDGRVVAKPLRAMGEVEYGATRLKDYLASHFHGVQLLRRVRHLQAMGQAGSQLDQHVLGLLAPDEPAAITRGWELTFSLLRGIDGLGRSMGAKTMALLVPSYLQVEERELDGWLSRHRLSRGDVQLDRPQRRMGEFGAAAGLEIVDLLPEFREWRGGPGAALHLRGDGHWSVRGHALAAEIAARELQARALIGAGDGRRCLAGIRALPDRRGRTGSGHDEGGRDG